MVCPLQKFSYILNEFKLSYLLNNIFFFLLIIYIEQAKLTMETNLKFQLRRGMISFIFLDMCAKL